MTLTKFSFVAILSAAPMLALAEPVPFTDANWTYVAGAQPAERNGEQALQLGIPDEGAFFGFGMAIANGAPFSNGIVSNSPKAALLVVCGSAFRDKAILKISICAATNRATLMPTSI